MLALTCCRIISSQKIYGLYVLKHHVVEMSLMRDKQTNEQLKIELLSQWKLEAESCNIWGCGEGRGGRLAGGQGAAGHREFMGFRQRQFSASSHNETRRDPQGADFQNYCQRMKFAISGDYHNSRKKRVSLLNLLFWSRQICQPVSFWDILGGSSSCRT